MQRLGLDYNTLSKVNPRLIYASVNGFGGSNPEPGFDYIMQAETGFMHITGEA
jgi:succinate--hydroxymethylglutarate CoA-transferase